jgi:hypothetical protein
MMQDHLLLGPRQYIKLACLYMDKNLQVIWLVFCHFLTALFFMFSMHRIVNYYLYGYSGKRNILGLPAIIKLPSIG